MTDYEQLPPGQKTLVPTATDPAEAKVYKARLWKKLTGKDWIDPDTGQPLPPT